MKERTSLVSLLIIIVLTASAQVPQKFNYQAVVRDAQDGLITNHEVGFKLSILDGSASGSPVYVETHTANTTGLGLANLVIGDGNVVSGSFEAIPWSTESYFLKVEVDPAGGTAYEHVGTSQLISVPYSLYSANLSSPTQKFIIQENPGHPVDSALFEVRNLEGQTVFAVYPEGTRVYVLDEELKGKKGGFFVGGYSRTTKGVTDEYMMITPDSIRLYIEESTTKGKKGGFKIGGYSRTTKGESEYFNISTDPEAEIIPGVNRVVWYPQRNAFLAGNVLVLDADSVGENSMAAGFQPQAIGDYSQAFGHQSIARGDFSTAIGDHATAHERNSVSIGTHSRADKVSSFALGSGAIAFGVNSYALGSSGVDSAGLPTGNTMSIGEQSFALGMGSKAEGFGSFSIGTEAQSSGNFSVAVGYKTIASGWSSTAVGTKTIASGWSSTAMGSETIASGEFAVAIGLKDTASCLGSVALGMENTASGWTSAAMGLCTTASGMGSTATGIATTASGTGSTAMGSYTIASGSISTAMGRGTRTGSYCSMVLGQYNANNSGDMLNWVDTDPLFIIGNGSDEDNLSNAMLVRKDGEVYFPDVYSDVVTTGRDLNINSVGQIGYISSSRRYKSNISPMEEINWIYKLNPVNFIYNSDETETKQYGLIAEEVEEVNPLFVSYNSDGEPETVSYSQLISPIIKALQDQEKLIKELQEEIELLKNNE